jgi:hypothetical protein
METFLRVNGEIIAPETLNAETLSEDFRQRLMSAAGHDELALKGERFTNGHFFTVFNDKFYKKKDWNRFKITLRVVNAESKIFFQEKANSTDSFVKLRANFVHLHRNRRHHSTVAQFRILHLRKSPLGNHPPTAAQKHHHMIIYSSNYKVTPLTQFHLP